MEEVFLMVTKINIINIYIESIIILCDKSIMRKIWSNIRAAARPLSATIWGSKTCVKCLYQSYLSLIFKAIMIFWKQVFPSNLKISTLFILCFFRLGTLLVKYWYRQNVSQDTHAANDHGPDGEETSKLGTCLLNFSPSRECVLQMVCV